MSLEPQTRSAPALAALNRDVWQAFQSAYAALDLDAFLAIHDPEMIRVEAAARWIGDRSAYGERTGRGFELAAGRGHRFAIDFRFDERIVNDALASERGVYRLAITAPDGVEQVFHGRFHTVSRRRPDGWRLVLDYDSNDGGTVGPEDFAGGHPMDETAFVTE